MSVAAKLTASSPTALFKAVMKYREAIRLDCVWKSEQVLDITDQIVLYHLCQLAATPGEHSCVIQLFRPSSPVPPTV